MLLKLTDGVCIKGHTCISQYLEVSVINSETPNNFTEKVKVIVRFIESRKLLKLKCDNAIISFSYDFALVVIRNHVTELKETPD